MQLGRCCFGQCSAWVEEEKDERLEKRWEEQREGGGKATGADACSTFYVAGLWFEGRRAVRKSLSNDIRNAAGLAQRAGTRLWRGAFQSP